MNLRLGKAFPITSKLNPFGGAKNILGVPGNLIYLADIALLTRMATAIVRVDQNRPGKLEDPRLSKSEKRLAFWERFFVEIIGTSGYMFLLHFGQDVASKIAEKRIKIPTIGPEHIADPAKREKANQAILDVFGKEHPGPGPQESGLMHRILYGKQLTEIDSTTGKEKITVQKATQHELYKKMGHDLFTKLNQPVLDPFMKRASRSASLTILSGVTLSALFGGFMIQWLNDRVVSPTVSKALRKRYGEMPPPKNRNTAPTHNPAVPQAPVNQVSNNQTPAAPTPPGPAQPMPAQPPAEPPQATAPPPNSGGFSA